MTVKHPQLPPTVGQVSDDPLMDSMASPSQDGTLEKGTALTFGTWICITDGSGGGSGGFISQLDDRQAEELDSTNQQPPNNSAASAAVAENPPEDSQEG